VAKARAGLRVKKWGRTTGYTSGVIEARVPTPWVLPYKSSRFSADVWYQDTWTVRSDDEDPFALPGDSGSLIVTEDGDASVGMLFAVNTRGAYAIFFPIGEILDAFGKLTLAGQHGL
jgi:hypothetical protein